jgi:hypothetical protein
MGAHPIPGALDSSCHARCVKTNRPNGSLIIHNAALGANNFHTRDDFARAEGFADVDTFESGG